MAIIFHWPAPDLLELELDELVQWHRLAVERWNHIHEVKK
ncbi:MAG: GpE family phage tail protein [Novosphingobium sp.]